MESSEAIIWFPNFCSTVDLSSILILIELSAVFFLLLLLAKVTLFCLRWVSSIDYKGGDLPMLEAGVSS